MSQLYAFGTYNRLNLHVNASAIDVIRAARKRIMRKARRDPALRDKRHEFFRAMIEHHKAARGLFVKVYQGEFA
ncbi:hypothetical protein UFOVP62_48 [uncultured Caudovirales phage]|uniref:Uncharacterized protein n=1 Tax=uncultured Caudovirales phage TaxID=2100421 RepID=A0A6J5KXL4_9CAUD|nr:hypothetical protein UFOVP62_48 [uncultured Caudovirales phage]